MKIYATSDFHGLIPPPSLIPECDVLLLGGDICPDASRMDQLRWLDTSFRVWLNNIPTKKVVAIAGNHDFVFESDYPAVDSLWLPWVYLRDSFTTVGSLKIYGTPWVPNLPAWAFYAPKEDLKSRMDAVPKDIDIVLSHGPPYGLGDLSVRGNTHTGSKSVNDMLGRVRPKALVCGHIHEGYGHYRYQPQHGDPVEIYNVSYLDENYHLRPIADPIIEIIVDGKEESPDKQREIHTPVTSTGSPSESPEGS